MTDKEEALARFMVKLENLRRAELAYANEIRRLRELLKRCANYIGSLEISRHWKNEQDLLKDLEEFK